jgi:hypothetical protein
MFCCSGLGVKLSDQRSRLAGSRPAKYNASVKHVPAALKRILAQAGSAETLGLIFSPRKYSLSISRPEGYCGKNK